jgi:hypothetical protein
VFHAEFARHILFPIALNYPDIRYNLFAEDEIEGGSCAWGGSAFLKLDNAKAQYKCPNIHCQRLKLVNHNLMVMLYLKFTDNIVRIVKH